MKMLNGETVKKNNFMTKNDTKITVTLIAFIPKP